MPDEKSKAAECRLIRMKEVMHISGLSRTALYLSIKRKDFPAPVKLSARAVAWPQDEVVAWVKSRVRSRSGSASG